MEKKMKTMKMMMTWIAVVGLVLALAPTPASAQWTTNTFTASDAAANDKLGLVALSMGGNIGLAGCSAYNSNTGKAYLFDVTTGAQLHRLDAPTPAASEYFGIQTSTDGTLALVGARGVHEAYLFSVSSGALLATLPNPGGNSGFGSTLAVSGNRAVVGAEWTGKVYVYDVSTPASPVSLGSAPISVLNASCIRGDHKTLDLDGNILIMGAAPYSSNQGGAWLYDLSGLGPGTGTATPVALNAGYTPTGTEQLMFGTSVDIQGSLAIVGAPGAGGGSTDPLYQAGMAFLFDVSNPASPVKLCEIVPSDRAYRKQFGDAVGISGDTAIVGTLVRYADPTQWNVPGEAYLFDVSTPATPSQIQKMTTGVIASVDKYGQYVGIDGNMAVVSAYEDDQAASNAGAVYIYTGSSGGGATPGTLIYGK